MRSGGGGGGATTSMDRMQDAQDVFTKNQAAANAMREKYPNGTTGKGLSSGGSSAPTASFVTSIGPNGQVSPYKDVSSENLSAADLAWRNKPTEVFGTGSNATTGLSAAIPKGSSLLSGTQDRMPNRVGRKDFDYYASQKGADQSFITSGRAGTYNGSNITSNKWWG